MFLIVGLGNPKREYENTRHNIGFAAVDAIAERYKIPVLERKHKAMIGKGYIAGRKVILAKPQTYMNLSGESVREITDYYKLDPVHELVVICDDINLELGQLRIRAKGSAGGHNGIKNIIQQLGSDAFCRIRIGVGGKPENYDLADYVLGHFTEQEKKLMAEHTGDVAKAVELMLTEGVGAAMNRYNQKRAKKPEEGMDQHQ